MVSDFSIIIDGWDLQMLSLKQWSYHNLDENIEKHTYKVISGDFPGGAVVKNPPANAGDTGLSPGPGRSHMPQSN